MQQTLTNRHGFAYVALIVAGATLGALGIQIAGGNVPIPASWAWLSPVLLAGIVSLTTMLPRITDAPPPVSGSDTSGVQSTAVPVSADAIASAIVARALATNPQKAGAPNPGP